MIKLTNILTEMRLNTPGFRMDLIIRQINKNSSLMSLDKIIDQNYWIPIMADWFDTYRLVDEDEFDWEYSDKGDLMNDLAMDIQDKYNSKGGEWDIENEENYIKALNLARLFMLWYAKKTNIISDEYAEEQYTEIINDDRLKITEMRLNTPGFRMDLIIRQINKNSSLMSLDKIIDQNYWIPMMASDFDTYELYDEDEFDAEYENGDLMNNLAVDIQDKYNSKGGEWDIENEENEHKANSLARLFMLWYAKKTNIISDEYAEKRYTEEINDYPEYFQ
jgi:hypothetical protein